MSDSLFDYPDLDTRCQPARGISRRAQSPDLLRYGRYQSPQPTDQVGAVEPGVPRVTSWEGSPRTVMPRNNQVNSVIISVLINFYRAKPARSQLTHESTSPSSSMRAGSPATVTARHKQFASIRSSRSRRNTSSSTRWRKSCARIDLARVSNVGCATGEFFITER